MQEELESLKDNLRSEKNYLAAVTSDRDKLRSQCEEKNSELQVVVKTITFLYHANFAHDLDIHIHTRIYHGDTPHAA